MYSIIRNKCFCIQSILKRISTKTIELNEFKFSSKASEDIVNELSADVLKPGIYSYLYISPRFASIVFNVLKPKYDLNYFKQIVNNFNDIEINCNKRNIDLGFHSKQVINDLKKLIDLKTRLEPKLHFKQKLILKMDSKKKKNKLISEELSEEYKQISSEVRELNEKIYDLEETVMKFVLNIPNDISVEIKEDMDLIHSFEPKNKSKQLFKHLNYIQLSYINNCLVQSIVGPKSCYLTGITTQLNDSLIEYFGQYLRQNQFIDISGIDFVKTAVIEATNSDHSFDPKSDELQIRAKVNQTANEELNQSLHLVGNSSFESICALISKRDFEWTSKTIKLLSFGQEFYQDFSQNNSINATIITEEDNDLSDNEFNSLFQLLWKCFVGLDLKCRAIRPSSGQLGKCEFSRIEVQVWLKSQNQWITASHISQYKQYICVRMGAKDSHLINSSVNLFSIIIAIIEQNQTNEGNIEIPECLKQYLI